MLEKPTKNKKKVEGLNDKKKMRAFSGTLVFVFLLSTVHSDSDYDTMKDANLASLNIVHNKKTGKSSFCSQLTFSPSKGENLKF